MNEKEEILLQEEIEESMEISFVNDLQILETVSGGDIYTYTISGNDVMLLDAGSVDNPLQKTNYLLSAIFFFMILTWCIDRIKSGIRRLMKHE